MIQRLALWLMILPAALHGAVFSVQPGESIQTAVNAAAVGDTVLLTDGHYTETVVLYGKVLTIGSLFLLDGDTTHVARTIITPDSMDPDTGSCFVYTYYEPVGGRLVGLTLRDGRGTYSSTAEALTGGGVATFRASVSVEYCRFENCSATLGGGFIAWGGNWLRTVRLDHCRFDRCFAVVAGAAWVRACSVWVSHCVFDGDSASIATGGMHIDEGYAEMDHCSFTNCFGPMVGALVLGRTAGWIRNSRFEGNGSVAEDYGTAHLIFSDCDADISRCVFANNTGSVVAVWIDSDYYPLRFFGNVVAGHSRVTGTGAIHLANNSIGEIAYCLIADNVSLGGGALWYQYGARVHAHHNSFERNIALEPRYASAVGVVWEARPVLDSNRFVGHPGPVIGYVEGPPIPVRAEHNWWGHASGPYHPTLNPAGQGDTLVQDSVYFIPWLTEPPDTTMPAGVSERPRPGVIGTWRLLACYPNPFNSTLRLDLAGFTGADFRIALYDLLGREVAVLHEGPLTGGNVSFAAPPTLASGVYFLSAHDHTQRETRKVVFLR